MGETLKSTPFAELHRAAGAKMAPFAGYDMPVQYAGVLAEHAAVRHRIGIFDVSHMGHAIIENPAVSFHLSRPIEEIAMGKSCYLLILNAQGGIIDDCIVYRIGAHRWHIIANASRKEVDFDALEKIAPIIRRPELAMIACQGPGVLPLLGELAPRRGFTPNREVLGVEVELTARTGYTGEDGYEFVLEGSLAPELWTRLIEKGAEPCGLAARDLLRIEAGLPLYGSDMDETTTPYETGLEFALHPDRDFIAHDSLTKRVTTRRRAGLTMPKGAVPRHGYPVLDAAGAKVGEVTSGTFSPLLDKGLALAIVAADSKPAAIEIRGRACPAEEVSLPFYRRKKS